MSEAAHIQTAARLRDAYSSGPIPPLRDVLSAGDGTAAYAIQRINTEFWVAQGRRVVGRKVGLTAKAVQAQLGVSQPDYGVLFEDMMVADGANLSASKTLQPKAEVEVALILAEDLHGPTIAATDVLAATSHVVTAIEIVDSRIADWKLTFADTVADNGSSGYFVLGSNRLPAHGLDLWSCGMVLEVNGEVTSVGAGAACLGHPLNAAAWLARTVPLRKGDCVLTGALGPMVTLHPGDVVRATIGGLGSCSFRYYGERS
jgi:2-keto-4-pentenoate hydratase